MLTIHDLSSMLHCSCDGQHSSGTRVASCTQQQTGHGQVTCVDGAPCHPNPVLTTHPQIQDGLNSSFKLEHLPLRALPHRSEMQEFVKSVSGEANLPLVPEEQLDFTMKLYDLNQVR